MPDVRLEYLNKILESDNPKKIIISGPGTGKTYTFKKLFEKIGDGNFLALTFIRKLSNSLQDDLPAAVNADTFHAFCKGIMHHVQGKVDIFPQLSDVILKDAEVLDPSLKSFDKKFQLLEEDGEEINFYLRRGDYYEYLSFNDSVYRLYKELIRNPGVLPAYSQIVIDEYQDFNPPEVAFINELEKKGPILIVGDDDQAVYSNKHSSPEYIREKYNSGEYEVHELPYCSRCPNVIINATNEFVANIVDVGGLSDRIEKRFLPFLSDDNPINLRYSQIEYAEVPVLATLTNYIKHKVSCIPEDEIDESFDENYPTALIIGQSQYITQLYKKLEPDIENIEIKVSDQNHYNITDGMAILLNSENNNLGWRILIEFLLPPLELTDVIN
jgi:superfamily I DNA/RNA helicase